MPWLAAIPIIEGGIKLVEGESAKHKANKEAAVLKKTRPKLGRDAIADENLALTKSDLAQGMSAKAEKAYTDLADRDFSSSLSTILKGGGNLNDVGSVYGNKESGRQQLALLKDNLRLQQIQNEVNASQKVSARNDEQFLYNTDSPWKDAAQANAGARKDAETSIWSGLQTIGSAAMQFGQQTSEANLYDKYFGVPKQSTSTDGVSRLPQPEIDRSLPTAQTTQLPSTLENTNQFSGTENEQLYNYLFPNRKI